MRRMLDTKQVDFHPDSLQKTGQPLETCGDVLLEVFISTKESEFADLPPWTFNRPSNKSVKQSKLDEEFLATRWQSISLCGPSG